MSDNKRKVSFYKLSLEKIEFIPHSTMQKTTVLSEDRVEEKFKSIYDYEMKSLSNGNKAIDVETPNSNYVVEVVSYKDSKAFMKIGQQNPANTVALRDSTTLESEDVPMKASQQLELFTFCLIDFNTCVLSYIGINGAPKISAIKSLFEKYLFDSEHILAKLASIVTNDILQYLTKKQIISKLSITVAIPSDEVLSDVLGTGEKDFDDLRNIKTKTATYNIVASRNKNIFSNSSNLLRFISRIKEKFGDDLCNLQANAKDNGEGTQTYDLLQYNFTKTVTIGSKSALITVEDFQDALENTYDTYKDELLTYCI